MGKLFPVQGLIQVLQKAIVYIIILLTIAKESIILKNKMKIIHISDLHILKVKGSVFDFLNKRIIGLLNIYINRRGEYSIENVEKLFDDIKKQDYDHIVITGDFTNLALPSEFEKNKELLEKLGDSSKISIIPGNHDSYIKSAVKKRYFQKYFNKWLVSDIKIQGNNKFPYVRLLNENIAIIGFNSSIADCLFCSSGKISKYQIDEFERIMKNPNLKNRYKIVLIHHHLAKNIKLVEWMFGMRDRKKIVTLFSKYKIDLVLHGHRHINSEYEVGELNLKVQETGASARYAKNSLGSYSIYEIKNNKFVDKKVRVLDYKNKNYKYK